MIRSPLEQFNIKSIIRGYNKYMDISISNVTLYEIISIIIIIIIFIYNIRRNIIGSRYQRIIEITMELLIKEIIGMIGSKGKKYIPLLITFFYFILINNLLGLIPYSYTTTSQIILTISLSLSIIIGITIIGIINHGIKFIKVFIPSNVPILLLLILVPIEIISYISRIISLSVRITCNLLSGHILLYIISNFGYLISKYNIFLSFIPIIILFFLFGLELGVAFIQASIFIILIASYLKDILYLSH